MRDIIDLLENIQKHYYHGSSIHLPVGTILRPSLTYSADWGDTDFYDILEHYRPRHMLSHAESVFLCDNADDIDNAGGGTDWLFTVIPNARIERHDLNWSSEISGLSKEDDIEAIEYAANAYWSGLPHHNENVWEYLTPSAEIIKVEEY
jgi:hypothetical protein